MNKDLSEQVRFSSICSVCEDWRLPALVKLPLLVCALQSSFFLALFAETKTTLKQNGSLAVLESYGLVKACSAFSAFAAKA